MRRLWTALAVSTLTLASCSLSTNVTIEPLLVKPRDVVEPQTLEEALSRGDYRRAVAMRRAVDAARNPDPQKLALLGRAHMNCGLYDEGKEILESALVLRMPSELRGNIEWDLAQIAYDQGDTATALEFATLARSRGITIRQWYLDFLIAIQGLDLHSVEGARHVATDFTFGSPDLPRLQAMINGATPVEAVIDTGAAISIVSRSFADRARIRRFPGDEAQLYGLLGDPIPITFGMIDTLRIEGLTIRNAPVAVMPDEKLSFFVAMDQPFNIDVLIGTSVLRQFRLRFDYLLERLTLDYLEDDARVPSVDQNLFFVDQKPLVHATINHKGWYPFLLDTGSELTFLNDSKVSLKTTTYGLRRFHATTMQGLGGARKRGNKVRNISIGVHRWAGRFEHMPLYSDVRSGSIGILGQNYLKNFYVDIDFGRMRLEVRRAQGASRDR